MEPLPLWKRRLYLAALTAFFAVAIPLIILFASGYRLTRGWQIIETGGIYVHPLSEEGEVFMDDLPAQGMRLRKGLIIQNLTPGAHTAEVREKGRRGWQKTVAVRRRMVTEVYPLLFPNEAGLREVQAALESKREYESVMEFFAKRDRREFLTKEKGDLSVSAEGQKIFGQWEKEGEPAQFLCGLDVCSGRVLVASFGAPVRLVEFFPDRPEILIAAAGSEVIVIEIDRRDRQHSEVIFAGEAPEAAVKGGKIYVRDGHALYQYVI
ncbi:MAG: hypothetical protein HYT43_00690 [Candidatus Taylorbacteria bacterium]|nr:hypothetical protein [Candidatus Taylorbacteria bacterium]